MFKSPHLNNLCVIAIQEVAKRHEIEILEIEVDIYHIHVVCSIPMTMTPTKALHLLKGFSAKFLFTLVLGFRKRYRKGHLWSPGKFAASVGHITLENAKKYLETHKQETYTPLGLSSSQTHHAKEFFRNRNLRLLNEVKQVARRAIL